ncbi:MAG TPA: hypothetical protein VME69_10765 [Methylocella sp.]|nr:hypothetical protein [Methylocella sp.]
MRSVYQWFHLLIASAALVIAPPASAETLLDSYLAIRKLYIRPPGETEPAYRRQIQHQYKKLFAVAQSHVHQVSDTDLSVLVRAATEASLFTQRAQFLYNALADLKELASRGQATDRQYFEVYQELIHHRMFAEAAAMFKDHHADGMEPLPSVIDNVGDLPHARTEYQIASKGDELIRRASESPQTGILVVADPLCHFSVAAISYIHSDPILNPIFHDHSKWIAPSSRYINLRQFQEWDRTYPEATLSIVYRQRDWKFVDEWTTPTFYFFRNGRLIRKLTGWRGAGEAQAIEETLRSQGLIDRSVAFRPPAEQNSSAANGVSPDGAPKSSHNQHTIDLATAPIRSKDDLDAYLQRTPISESPFQYLSPLDRRIFLNEVTFSETGLTEFPPDTFETLTASQAHQLLALFGWQIVVPSLPGLRVQSSLDKAIMGAPSGH